MPDEGVPHRGLNIFPDLKALARGAAELFAHLVAQAVAADGRFSVALSGGSTPVALFVLLREAPFRERIAWDKLDIFWSDERAVPPGDPQSNYGMAEDVLLSRVPVPAERVHRMPAEREPLDAAAAAYEAEIRRALPAVGDVPRFDLVMLGMGDDGHTASLFPESPALDERERLVVPNYVAKLDARRMTFTPRLINAAANVLFLVAGESKADALAVVLDGAREPRRYPAQVVAPADGTLYWLVDQAAAAKLRRRDADAASAVQEPR